MKVGVREICDVVLKAKANTTIGNHTFKKGEPVIYFDTLKTSTLEGAATTVYAQGGRGNARLLAWEGERTLTFTMEDALISTKGLAILTGADLIHADNEDGKGKSVIAHATQQVQLKTDDTIVVDSEIATGTDIYVMLLDGNGEMSGVPVKIARGTEDANVSIADGKTTIKATEGLFKAEDVVFVDFYKEYKTDAVEITITADKFAGYYYLEASTLFRRESDGVDLPAEFIIPKAKIQSAFTFTMASSGDPSTFTFTLDALPDYTKFDLTKKVLCAIQVLEADDNYDLTSTEEDGEITYQRVSYNENTNGVYAGYEGKDAKGNKISYRQTSNDTPPVAVEGN